MTCLLFKLFIKLTLIGIFVYPYGLHAKVIKIGIVEYPPHISFNDELNKSKIYNYFTLVLGHLDFDVKFYKYPQKRGIIELDKGNIDLLLPYDGTGKDVRLLSKPIFHSVPGLCFKKEKFIPILSATHRFDKLIIGVPSGVEIVNALRSSNAKLVNLEGEDAISRGIDLTQRGRIDAFYHPSPIKVYHHSNILFKEVACSYFHGYSKGVYVAASSQLKSSTFNDINSAFLKMMESLSYEYYRTQ